MSIPKLLVQKPYMPCTKSITRGPLLGSIPLCKTPASRRWRLRRATLPCGCGCWQTVPACFVRVRRTLCTQCVPDSQAWLMRQGLGCLTLPYDLISCWCSDAGSGDCSGRRNCAAVVTGGRRVPAHFRRPRRVCAARCISGGWHAGTPCMGMRRQLEKRGVWWMFNLSTQDHSCPCSKTTASPEPDSRHKLRSRLGSRGGSSFLGGRPHHMSRPRADSVNGRGRPGEAVGRAQRRVHRHL